MGSIINWSNVVGEVVGAKRYDLHGQKMFPIVASTKLALGGRYAVIWSSFLNAAFVFGGFVKGNSETTPLTYSQTLYQFNHKIHKSKEIATKNPLSARLGHCMAEAY
ncbi:MAG: hypothetical protein J3R72DRAFT_492284 [Linnemannia gamsii]|nr:MAG: hypothetical protein J3R72DRAFT_492284 [Linnemannia gamsii]